MGEDWVEPLLNFGIPAFLITLGFFVGSWVERRHFRRLVKSEDELQDIMGFAIRRIPQGLNLSKPQLVSGSAVISVDYFKKFAASLRGIIGGRIGAYESLYERARREAIIRMKKQARRQGADIVLNIKFETVRIFGGTPGATVSVEALAYGTAYRRNHAAPQIL